MTSVRQMIADPAWVEAHAQGLKHYRSAQPCPKPGHEWRYVTNGLCVACASARNSSRRRGATKLDDREEQRELDAITGHDVVSTDKPVDFSDLL